MVSTKKILFSAAGLSIFGLIVNQALKLKGKADAGNDLKLTLNRFKLNRVSVKDGINFMVVLNAHNNSSHSLSFTQPFVQISILNANGKLQPIAFSNTATGDVLIKPRSTSQLSFDLFIPPLQALQLPGLLFYLISRFAGVEPNSTKKLNIEYGLLAEGVEIKSSTDTPI